jgi:hypothetical protein
MSGSSPAPGPSPLGWEELLAEVNYRIAEAEMRSTAQVAVVGVLTRAGYDATDAADLLWGYMDTLIALRRQRCGLRGLDDAGANRLRAPLPKPRERR